jgi:hypothetical protein
MIVPLPYPVPPPPSRRPGAPPGPHDLPDVADDTASWHPQHQPVPLELGASEMYPGMLSWHPTGHATSQRNPVLPVMFR